MKKFTLIELLVVIAIIGILASILMPSLSKARKKTQQAVCMNSIRQASLAVLMYADDNAMYGPSDKKIMGKRWYDLMQPDYLPENEIPNASSPTLYCPIAKKVDTVWGSNLALNPYISGKQEDNFNYDGISIAKATTEETGLFFDAYNNWRGLWPTSMVEYKMNQAPETLRIAKHFGKANVGYVDGHVKAISTTTLAQYNNKFHTFWDPSK